MKYKITDLFELKMGKTPSRSNPNYWNGTNVWLSVSDLSSSGKYISCSKERITEQAIDESKIQMIPKDTVVMSFKLSLGKVSITTHNMYTNEAIIAFVDKKSEKVDPSYLYYWCLSQNWEKYGNKAVMGVTLNKKTLTSLSIELPPYELQKRIVKRLDLLANLLEAKNIQLQSLQQLVQSRFIEMFGDPILNPKGWIQEELSKYSLKISDGEHTSVPRVESGIPFLNAKHILSDGEIDFSSASFISEENHNRIFKRCNPEINDILLTTTGTIGNTAIVKTEKEFSMDRGITLIKIDKSRINQFFLAQLLKMPSSQEWMRRNTTTATIGHLFLNKVRSFPTIIPSKSDQDDFSYFLDQITKSKFICLINA
ncbi:restriction endonuclease subunit S [Faecalibaculum rodentium]|uniref:restriction endonuclease subunit S n=2 Tax=Faecalibaculum rodentium TaxID=1702221 RepID=UPI00249179CB|nr:restriction endonuclease subunit S [Faecalibaculum rodentium]